jgi:hypothetical protein
VVEVVVRPKEAGCSWDKQAAMEEVKVLHK